MVDVVIYDASILLGIRSEPLYSTLKLLLDAPLGGNAVEGLHTVPGGPLLAGLVLIALSASRNAVAGLVFSAT